MRKIIFAALLVCSLSMWARMPAQLEDLNRSITLQSQQYHEENLFATPRVTTQYEVGDSRSFWRWNLSVMPPTWIQETGTCKAVGEHCYVFVADSQWNLHMDQADVDAVLVYLEEETFASTQYGAIEMDETIFGPVPDELDNDPKVIIFYSALGSFNGTSFDGYFSSYNQVTEQQAQQMNPSGHSNECEMIYMTCHPLNPTEPIRISVLSHELQHMIHWGGDINEDTWVNEGCSELAMISFGMPDPITVFPNQSDNSLNSWNQQWADYVKVQLFFGYLAEKYAVPGDSLMKDIVFEPQNGIAGIQTQLVANNSPKDFAEIFVDWTVTNYLNDLQIADGLYGYETMDVPQFLATGNHNSFPAVGSGSVKAWAADYIRCYPGDSELDFYVTASSPITGTLIYKVSDTELPKVEIFPITASCEVVTTNAPAYQQVVLVLSNDSDVAVNYTYDVEISVSVPQEPQVEAQRLSIYPNPCSLASGEVLFALPQGVQRGTVTLYNVKGQQVLKQGLHPEQKNQTMPLTDVGSGIYFLQVQSGEKSYQTKLILTQ